MKPMLIGINFPDNDFHNTFANVLRVLQKIDFIPSKDQLLDIINNISFGIYLLHQNRFEYNTNSKEQSRIRKYLQLTKENILIGDEVSKFVKENDWNNCEFHYTNLFSDDKKIYLL